MITLMNLKKNLFCALIALTQTVWRKGLCLYGIKLLKVVHKTNVLPFEKYIQWSIASIESKIKIE